MGGVVFGVVVLFFCVVIVYENPILGVFCFIGGVVYLMKKSGENDGAAPRKKSRSGSTGIGELRWDNPEQRERSHEVLSKVAEDIAAGTPAKRRETVFALNTFFTHGGLNAAEGREVLKTISNLDVVLSLLWRDAGRQIRDSIWLPKYHCRASWAAR